eukprot:1234777-Amphidinium_carterae.1
MHNSALRCGPQYTRKDHSQPEDEPKPPLLPSSLRQCVQWELTSLINAGVRKTGEMSSILPIRDQNQG